MRSLLRFENRVVPFALCLAAPLAAHPLAAQSSRNSNAAPVRPEPAGTVTGHVFCTDTNQPARFAAVSLEPVPAPHSAADTQPGAPGSGSAGPGVSAARVAKSQTGGSAGSPMPAPADTVATSLDGSFTIRNVKPGNYYVVAEEEGYLNPRAMFTAQELADPSPEMRALVQAALPVVHVDANRSDNAELRLQRGGAISGTVRYDDGSPAGGLPFKILHRDDTGKWVAEPRSWQRGMLRTDDRGSFRVGSLLAGDYLVEVDLELNDSSTKTTETNGRVMQFALVKSRFSLPFYGAGTPVQSDAVSIKLRPGDEVTGQDMTIPVAKLHHLTGRVAAGRDAHFVNAADVKLVMRDSNKVLAEAKVSRDDGLFHFDFVPDGDYVLKVNNARDVEWVMPAGPKNGPPDPFPQQEQEHTVQTYGDTEMPMLLRGDMYGVTATVAFDPKKTTPGPGLSNSPGADN